MNTAELFAMGYIIFGMIMLIILIAIIFLHNNRRKNEIIKKEFSLIKPGDIYECKYDVNAYGLSSTNPYKQFKYKVISKKEGWVEMEALDVVQEERKKYIYASVKELLGKNYKCINNIR